MRLVFAAALALLAHATFAAASPAEQMMELVRSVHDTLTSDQSEALKANARRKSDCMAQEESLRR